MENNNKTTLKKAGFNIAVISGEGWIAQAVSGYIFNYGGFSFGIINNQKNNQIAHRKYSIIELQTGLSIGKDFSILKNLDFEKVFTSEFLQLLENTLNQYKKRFKKCAGVSDFDYFKNICKNNI